LDLLRFKMALNYRFYFHAFAVVFGLFMTETRISLRWGFIVLATAVLYSKRRCQLSTDFLTPLEHYPGGVSIFIACEACFNAGIAVFPLYGGGLHTAHFLDNMGLSATRQLRGKM